MPVTRSNPGRNRAASRGVVLIFVAGILTLLAALGMAFYVATHSSTMSAIRYDDMVRSELLSRAGLNEAVARLREQTFRAGESPADMWYLTDWLRGAQRRISYAYGDGKDSSPGDGIIDNEAGETRQPYTRVLSSSAGENSDRYILEIEDAASKININACDNLAVVLDNLCRLIGPPLVPADPDLLQPRRWYIESGNTLTAYACNTLDTAAKPDLYYELDTNGRPVQKDQSHYSGMLGSLGKVSDGTAVFGDGYAIAGYRSRNGSFQTIEQLKRALTYVERNGNAQADDPLETLELEAKLAALRPYVTTHSWIDTNTVCTGKFEWVTAPQQPVVIPKVRNIVTKALELKVPCQILIDRDKSWVADDPENDPLNQLGSLRGSYVSIMNGHGAGQLRRIVANGTDWIAIRGYGSSNDESLRVPPGPISSYLIIAREDARVRPESGVNGGEIVLPVIDPETGVLMDDPDINYSQRPLCIHRAPVNINTASDKVLAALFLGVNVQHGHPQSVGTDADLTATVKAWREKDYATVWPCLAGAKNIEPYVLTFQGLKRVPVSSGKLFFDMTRTIEDILPAALKTSPCDLTYITNGGAAGLNEAHELAARIISARTVVNTAAPETDPFTTTLPGGGFKRGPFMSLDDFYFRVIRPWDDQRILSGKASIAPMLMAMSNSNTDILKFNPNIEWIDRWGRNFTEMEPVMVYTNDLANNGTAGNNTLPGNPLLPGCAPIFARELNVPMPGYMPWNPVTLADFWHWVLESNKTVGRGDGAFIVRSQRYKSDELIDKTDLNRSTTEFSFGSNGIFEVTSTGQVHSPQTGQLLAERKAEVVLKAYDVWRESNQSEFVNGEFMEAANQNLKGAMSSFAYSGRVTRDGVHGAGNYATKPVRRLAITSHPEPLVPLNYTLQRTDGIANAETVDPGNLIRDAYGREKSDRLKPDILSNNVLPARYDGQLTLAVNTPRWDPSDDKDTFLANFIGDLDTTFSVWNGREQSKVPNTLTEDGMASEGYKYRVVDTFGLLGLLNDTLVDVDPDLANRDVYCFATVNAALAGLAVCDPADPDKSYYYNNVTLRMGDLRPDGVFLSGSGISGRDATLKYLIGDPDECPAGDYTPGNAPRQNFNPNATDGWTISMWMKPTWHQDDGRRHEFFNAGNPGYGANSRGCFLVKEGRYHFAGDQQNSTFSNNARIRNDLHLGRESQKITYSPGSVGGDDERSCAFFGGSCYVPKTLLADPNNPGQAGDPTKHIESPAYYTQPFRWHFVGGRSITIQNLPKIGAQQGHWRNTSADAFFALKQVCGGLLRPFINSALLDEKDFSRTAELMWGLNSSNSWIWGTGRSDIGHKGEVYPGSLDKCCTGGWRGQDARWDWADPVGINPGLDKVFSINNLNYGKAANNATMGAYQYRHMPDEGTYAVIDSLKISHKSGLYKWDGGQNNLPDHGSANLDDDRAYQETTLSRYYLPPTPASPDQLPWFKSQTLANAIRGAGSKSVSEEVSAVRVTWTGFAPRFMHEYRQRNGTFKRNEYITYDKVAANQKIVSFNIPGPFDVRLYNDDMAVDDATIENNRQRRHASAARPYPTEYPGYPAQPYHAAAGFKVELLKDDGTTITRLDNKTFTNPDAQNVLGSAESHIRVRADQLRYLVRFRYPVDPLVDPLGGTTVDPASHYMLDTPVFDDISITYFTSVRFLSYRYVTE